MSILARIKEKRIKFQEMIEDEKAQIVAITLKKEKLDQAETSARQGIEQATKHLELLNELMPKRGEARYEKQTSPGDVDEKKLNPIELEDLILDLLPKSPNTAISKTELSQKLIDEGSKLSAHAAYTKLMRLRDAGRVDRIKRNGRKKPYLWYRVSAN